jgi:hypothetical protein
MVDLPLLALEGFIVALLETLNVAKSAAVDADRAGGLALSIAR